MSVPDFEIVRTALKKRTHWGFSLAPESAQAFRWLHGAADGWSSGAIDAYAGYAVVQFYDSVPSDEQMRLCEHLIRCGALGVYVKFRPKQANVIRDSRCSIYAPRLPLLGKASPDPLIVKEHGASYCVRLGDGLSTGLFLDQRDNRQRLQRMAKGCDVLNLFSYTGAFSIAAGSAKSVVNVDVSKQTSIRARDNIEHAKLKGEHICVVEDVFEYLKKTQKKNVLFDGVVLDPPTYAKTKSSRFNTDRDYTHLLAQVLRRVRPKGFVLACSNQASLSPDKFLRWCEKALRLEQRKGRVEWAAPPKDFPVRKPHYPHLKSAWLMLG